MVELVGETWQLVILGADALALYLLKRWYHSTIKSAEDVQEAASYAIDEDLEGVLKDQPDQQVPYACIEGTTYSLHKPLPSHYVEDEKGVLQKLLFVEHKSKRTNGYWSDAKNIIKDKLNLRPFSLAGANGSEVTRSPILVEVTEPLSADFLMDSLTTTYDKYVPNSDTLLSRGIDRMFGEVSKGYQETEKMLSVGVNLLGIGKIALVGGKMVLEPPTDPSKLYILTTLSKKQIVKDLKGNARVIKVFMWILGLCGSGLLCYLLYKNVKGWIEYIKMNRMYNTIREQRQRQESQNRGSDAETEDSNTACVVCLTNRREVVLLECGHICVCADCVRLLPQPRKCPICRNVVTRFVSTYVS